MSVDYTDSRDISFSLKRDESGITGFTLKALETYAQCFCVSFVPAQAQKKSRIVLDKKTQKIIFYHDGISVDSSIYGSHEGGKYVPELSVEDAKELDEFLNGRGKYEKVSLGVKIEEVWGKGFTLYAKEAD